MSGSEGWGFVLGIGGRPSTKAHYFGEDGRSLCRNWMRFNLDNLEPDDRESPDDCSQCRRALARRKTDG